MHLLLYIIALILCFTPALPLGVIIFFLTWLNEADTGDKKDKYYWDEQEKYKDYCKYRNKNPFFIENISERKLKKSFGNKFSIASHNKWLVSQLKEFEYIYRDDGIKADYKFKESLDVHKNIVTSKETYLKLCSKLKEKPSTEIIEDWDFVNEHRIKTESEDERRKIEDEELQVERLHDAKYMVIDLNKENKTRQFIVQKLHKEGFKVSVINGEWEISLDEWNSKSSISFKI